MLKGSEKDLLSLNWVNGASRELELQTMQTTVQKTPGDISLQNKASPTNRYFTHLIWKKNELRFGYFTKS